MTVCKTTALLGVMGSTYTSAEALSSMAARALFYPSLLYNVTRSSLQENWHWFDEITEVRDASRVHIIICFLLRHTVHRTSAA